MAGIPITLLTGFLGSGKTTLLNRWLHDPRLAGCAVLVNEFGEIGLDHAPSQPPKLHPALGTIWHRRISSAGVCGIGVRH